MSYQGASPHGGGFAGSGSSKHTRSSVTHPDQSANFEKFIFVTPTQAPEEAAQEIIEHLRQADSKSVSA